MVCIRKRTYFACGVMVVAFFLSLPLGCWGESGSGGGEGPDTSSGLDGTTNGYGDGTSNPDSGGDPAECRTACEKKVELCDRLGDDYVDGCVQECTVAVNAQEAIEETLDADSCFVTGQFVTPREAYCNRDEPENPGEIWDAGWSTIGDVGAVVDGFIDGQVVDGPDGQPLLVYDYESDDDAPKEVRAARFDGSSWSTLGAPITRSSSETGVRVLDAKINGEGTPLALIADAEGNFTYNRKDVELFEFDGSAWASVKEFGGGQEARLTLGSSGRAVVTLIEEEGPLSAELRNADGTWTSVETSESFEPSHLTEGSTVGARYLKVADWPGRDPLVMLGEASLHIFRVSGEGVSELSPTPPKELFTGVSTGPIADVGLSPEGTPHVAAIVESDPGDSSATYDEKYSGYFYKWNGSDWKKATTDDCLDAQGFSLGTPRFFSADPKKVVATLGDLLFDKDGVALLAKYGQLAEISRLAEDGRFYPWVSQGGSQRYTSTRSGTRLVHLEVNDDEISVKSLGR